MKPTAILGSVAFLSSLALGCDAKCHAITTDVHPDNARYAWYQCSDDQNRTIECKRSGAGHDCVCLLGDKPGKTFRVPMQENAFHSHMITVESAKEQCGWQKVQLLKF